MKRKSLPLLIALSFFSLTLFSQVHNSEKNLRNLEDLSLEELLCIPITTASQQEETIKETPIPVTIITSEMITNCGAKNLRDLLALYVPGMTVVQDHNEMNIAMRGVYGSSQQKILVMLNGHRMNSRSYSEANPDYAMSLEKVRQIEILRGPGSSLYGNVALTAVVNVITKSGIDQNGCTVEVGAGDFGQQKVSLLYGDSLAENKEFLVWVKYYKADGQKVAISREQDYSANPQEGYAIVDGVKDMPSYDAGFSYKANKFSFLGYSSYTKYIEPFTAGGNTGEVYNYSDYRTFLGTGPGLGNFSSGIDGKYETNLGSNFNLSLNGYADMNTIEVALVSNPQTKSFATPMWKEFSEGATAQLTKQYETNNWGKGSILVGSNVDRMAVVESFYPAGTNGEFRTINDSTTNRVLEKGDETILSAFVQLKHMITCQWIVNIGGRYDNKNRHKGANITNFSPRLSLIYLMNENCDIKLSYSNSFVDAPYWYRYTSLASYKGSADLKPELLSSVQFTPSYSFMDKKMRNTFNLFYNSLQDLIYRDPLATGAMPRYTNAGSLKSWGIEDEIAYSYRFIKARGVFTYQQAITAEKYGITGKQINNIPTISANLILDINPFYNFYRNFGFNISYRYIGQQSSPIAAPFLGGNAIVAQPDNKVASANIINSGIRIDKFHGLSFDARVYNLLATNYQQGGSTKMPYPQAGRWYMLTLGYTFR